MSEITKRALEASLKKLLRSHPFDEIFVKDLVEECGISRSAFYYHFNSIDELVQWSTKNDFLEALNGKTSVSTWQEGMIEVMKELQKDRDFIYNIINFMDLRSVERYLVEWTKTLLMNPIEESSIGLNLSEADKNFVRDLYSYSFVGVVMEWVIHGMKEPIEQVVSKLGIALKGSFRKSLSALAK